jgi:hypothetical protein
MSTEKKTGTVEFTSDNGIDFTLLDENGDALEDMLEEPDPTVEYSKNLDFGGEGEDLVTPTELAAKLRTLADWLDKRPTARIRADID